jgi:uncharacterized membrane protein
MYYSFWWPSPILWIIIILAIVWAVRGGRHRRWDHHMSSWHHNYKSAKDILDERFAKGEMTEDEYKKACDTLKATQ